MVGQSGGQPDLTFHQTVGIVAAYVSNNHVRAGELPALIAAIHAALTSLGQPIVPEEPEPERPTPAQIRRSITQEALISFVDGKAYKTLKRHLATHGLTPQAYRRRYGLPTDYPMVAPTYSEARSAIARGLSLGRKAAGERKAEPNAERPAAKPGAEASKLRARRKKGHG